MIPGEGTSESAAAVCKTGQGGGPGLSSGFLSLMHAKTHASSALASSSLILMHASSALASSTLILMHAPCRCELWLAHACVFTASVYNTVHTCIGAVSRPWSRRTDVLRGAFDQFRTIV